jgi:hypothetical protein
LDAIARNREGAENMTDTPFIPWKGAFHPKNIPWIDEATQRPTTWEKNPDMYWNDGLQRYEVWKDGKFVSACRDDSPLMQVWFDDVMVTHFGKSHEVGK